MVAADKEQKVKWLIKCYSGSIKPVVTGARQWRTFYNILIWYICEDQLLNILLHDI